MPKETVTKSKTGKSDARSALRRGARDRRERNSRLAERRKKTSASIKKEHRSGKDRRDDARRTGLRRAGKNRRHE